MIVLFNIDGTLAHMNGARSPFDWKAVGRDTPDYHVRKMLRIHWGIGDTVIVVSGRDGICRPETEAWLKDYDIPYHALYMRPVGDNRADTIVKREIWDNDIIHNYPVQDRSNVLVYDDRDGVVKMWRELGIKVFQVAYGNF